MHLHIHTDVHIPTCTFSFHIHVHVHLHVRVRVVCVSLCLLCGAVSRRVSRVVARYVLFVVRDKSLVVDCPSLRCSVVL